jgi:methanogenic corrinoid protein MtbC1
VLALHKLRNVLPVSGSNGKLVMCCAMEGDFHELPTYMAQIILEDCGYEVINFGANTPLYSLAEEVLHYSPAIVCVAATVMDNLERSCRDYKDFRGQISKVKTSVVLGGRFFKEQDIIHRFPAELYAKSFTALSDFACKTAEEK